MAAGFAFDDYKQCISLIQYEYDLSNINGFTDSRINISHSVLFNQFISGHHGKFKKASIGRIPKCENVILPKRLAQYVSMVLL